MEYLMKQCYHCGWEWKKPHQPAFREMCPRCDSFLHCCSNCMFYDPTAHSQCKSSTTELVSDKEKSNFCDEFRFREKESTADSKPPSNSVKDKPEDKLDPREKWRRLFGES